MTVIADPNKRVWILARLGKSGKHNVVAGPTTWDVCEKAFARNRKKEGLFILTKGQVREFPKRLRRKNSSSSTGSSSEEQEIKSTSIDLFRISTKIALQNF